MKNEQTLKTATFITGFLAILSLGFFTASAVLADTKYYYVAADGTLEAETADMPMEAINEADDIKYNSGVITAEAYMALSGDEVVETSSDDDAYLYVDQNGDLEVETADTPREAINEADDIKYNSGVISAEAYMELSQ